MNIAVRMEGGAGDHLLANRFVYAIRDKYPLADVHLFSDTEGKTFQTELLTLLYPKIYTSVEIIPAKIRKPFKVRNQFGEEDYISHLENVPQEYLIRWDRDCDKFYDLHIDSLKFTEYDFDWQRYFRFFPQPTMIRERAQKAKHVTVHLRSTTNRANDLQGWYVQNVIERLSRAYSVRIIATEEDQPFYGDLPPNVEFVTGSLEKVVEAISSSKFFLSVDSGFTYVAYCFNIPTLTYNAFCRAPQQVAPHQIIRWTIFPERILPLNFDAGWVAKKIEQIINEPGTIILPQLDNFELQAVKRKNEIL